VSLSASLHIHCSGPLGNRRYGQTLNLGQIKTEMLPQQATQSRAIHQLTACPPNLHCVMSFSDLAEVIPVGTGATAVHAINSLGRPMIARDRDESGS
jgi:hypothetical protein